MIYRKNFLLPCAQFNQFIGFGHIYGERLFHHYMLACQQRFPGPVKMIGVGRGDNDQVNFRVADNALPVGHHCGNRITLFDESNAFGFGGADLC